MSVRFQGSISLTSPIEVPVAALLSLSLVLPTINREMIIKLRDVAVFPGQM